MMTTRRLNLDVQWQQVTDGTTGILIQVVSGIIYLADSDTMPAYNAPAHTMMGFITVSPPTKAWIRSGPDSTASVIIS